MKIGPRSIFNIIITEFDINARPRSMSECISDICLRQGWYSNISEAQEAADRWKDNVYQLLQNHHNTMLSTGRPVLYTFNSSSSYLVQGYAFVEGGESEAIRKAKIARSRLKHYLDVFETLSPFDFEALCGGILHIMGVSQPYITRASGDDGIDFYGKLSLEGILLSNHIFPTIQKQLSVWLIGQAKRYKATQVSTPDIRDLVGAIELAKGNAFAGKGFDNLNIRVCDPIFYLFFTTGSLSKNTQELLQASGVIGMDGEMIAAFLADQNVGIEADSFDATTFYNWMSQFQPAK